MRSTRPSQDGKKSRAERPSINLEALLEPYRDQESARAASILEDDNAKKILAVWPSFPLEWEAPKTHPPQDPIARWHWLWFGAHVNFDLLAQHSGLYRYQSDPAFHFLKSARLIFPDNTIHEWAAHVLRSTVVAFVARGRKREPPPKRPGREGRPPKGRESK